MRCSKSSLIGTPNLINELPGFLQKLAVQRWHNLVSSGSCRPLYSAPLASAGLGLGCRCPTSSSLLSAATAPYNFDILPVALEQRRECVAKCMPRHLLVNSQFSSSRLNVVAHYRTQPQRTASSMVASGTSPERTSFSKGLW